MDFRNIKIDDIDTAELYFKKMACSHMHMHREYPERYNEYRNLKISKSIEIKWMNDVLDEISNSIKNPDTNNQELVATYDLMSNIVSQLKTPNALELLFLTTEYVLIYLPLKRKVDIAEIIIGNGYIEYRGGMIFLAYDLGYKDFAKKLMEISRSIILSAFENNVRIETCSIYLDKCDKINKILKLH